MSDRPAYSVAAARRPEGKPERLFLVKRFYYYGFSFFLRLSSSQLSLANPLHVVFIRYSLRHACFVEMNR